MRINAINFNNNSMRQKQNFKAVKETHPGCAKDILGFTTKKIFDAVSDIKGVDVWFFDKIKGPAANNKQSWIAGLDVIVKTDRGLIAELAGTPDKKDAIIEQLKKILSWFNPKLNGDAAAAVKKIDTLDIEGIKKINETYFDKGARDAAIKAVMQEGIEGQKIINTFNAGLDEVMESSKTTPWQNKLDKIISGELS